MPIVAVAAVLLVLGAVVEVPSWWSLMSVGAFAFAMSLYIRVGTPRGAPVVIDPPVRGRWVAINSPASRVPSHGVHAWSQTYAIDLVADPDEGSRPGFAMTPLARRPEDFPGFGAPIHAPADGVVVRARGGGRDHWSRTSPLGLLYLVLESVREVLGPSGVLGNHVVLRTDDGAYVLMAHLQRRSLTVRRGDRVDRGDVIAACGNSGNSTEPHLHIQAMDRPSTWIAAGLPLLIDSSAPPGNGQHLQVG